MCIRRPLDMPIYKPVFSIKMGAFWDCRVYTDALLYLTLVVACMEVSMDDQGGSKYQVKSESQLYGQVVGENNQVVQNFHLPLDEKHRQDVEARRRQFCVPIL